MNLERMKVFHGLVNYGTQSGYLAKKLREKGVEAYSVTGYDRFDRPTDVTLKHSGANFIEKIYNYIWNKIYLLHCFIHYNVFHFYAGKTLTKSQWELPLYSLFGKKVIFEYLGSDVQLYRYSVEKYEYTNIIYRVDKEKAEERDREIKEMLKWHDMYADLQLVCAPCYSPFVPGSNVLPLGIDLEEFPYTPMETPEDKIKIMHAPTHRGNKGTKFVMEAIDRLIAEGYPVEKVLVENVSHSQLKEHYKNCHIFVDQLLAGWYGTASIEAMAIGRPVVCNINQEFYKYIDYGPQIPIINANPNNIYESLKNLIENKDELEKIGSRSRDFVEKIHNSDKIIDEILKLYRINL